MEYSFYDFLKLLGSLALFLYGMKIMSEGLQKFAGDRLRKILTAMTTNRVTGVLTGVLITALIQSSSATTVMVVSFVNAGLLTLSQSIGVIMGANIGTTVTAWIISALGFKVDIAAMALPLLAVGVPLLFSGKSNRKSIGEFIFGFSFLFMGLSLLKTNAPDLSRNPEMLSFVQNYTDMGFGSVILFVVIGTVLTMIVQASAATMAITLIMCANGWISFELGAALVLGENIGTTITANLAALTANTQARRAALAHLVFNVFGVIWVLCLFNPVTMGVSWFVEDIMRTADPAVAVSFKLSAFHTTFNICNVLILIWFVKLIEKTVCKIIPQREQDEEYRLRFITGGMLSTAELSILQARKEINLFLQSVLIVCLAWCGICFIPLMTMTLTNCSVVLRNIASLNQYLSSVEQGQRLHETEQLDTRTRYNEYIITGLRTMWGISTEELKSKFGDRLWEYCSEQAKPYLENGKLKLHNDRLKLTKEGIFVSDGIMSDLLEIE